MSKTLSIILLVLCIAGPVVATLWYESGRNDDVVAEILARAPEKGNFLVQPHEPDQPRRLKVTAGEKVRIRVRNIDTVTHGFAIPDLGIDAGEIKAGNQIVLELPPAEPGEYVFYCTTWCSEFHLQMRGVLEVVAR